MKKQKSMLILIDGMRPDSLAASDAANLQKFMQNNSFSLHARTVMPSITLPCITSLFMGVQPQVHGTEDNDFMADTRKFTSLFDLMHERGLKTASFYNWDQLRDLSKPGSVDYSICLNSSEDPKKPLGESDRELTSLALNILNGQNVDFSFLYLGCVDAAGHQYGWMSREYLAAIENADQCVGNILNNIGLDTNIYITSDHGGIGFGHGDESNEEMLIPFLTSDPNIPKGEIQSPVSILDIAPTIAAFHNLDVLKTWQGKPLQSR